MRYYPLKEKEEKTLIEKLYDTGEAFLSKHKGLAIGMATGVTALSCIGTMAIGSLLSRQVQPPQSYRVIERVVTATPLPSPISTNTSTIVPTPMIVKEIVTKEVVKVVTATPEPKPERLQVEDYESSTLFTVPGIVVYDSSNRWHVLEGWEWTEPALSPDQTRIAVVYRKQIKSLLFPSVGADEGLYIVNTDASNRKQITCGEYDENPFWIDDDTVGFIRHLRGGLQRYQMDIDENNLGHNLRVYNP